MESALKVKYSNMATSFVVNILDNRKLDIISALYKAAE